MDEKRLGEEVARKSAQEFCRETGYREKMREDEKMRWLRMQLFKAYMEARKAKRRTSDEQIFEMAEFENIEILAEEIVARTYVAGRGISFIVRDPVVREIFAAPFRDRVVHHFLYNMVAEWWDRRFIFDSYSCRKEKGTLFAIERLQKNIRRATRDGAREATAITMDVKGYFMSLDRKKLLKRIDWGLDGQFRRLPWLQEILHFLWEVTIMDDPTEHVELRGDLGAWKDLPASKSLFCQPEGKGIVIGNLSSQLLSNIFLDILDRYIVLELGNKYYGRYVDDFYIIVENDKLDKILDERVLIRKKLMSLGLQLHPKKIHVQNVRKGVKFVGVMVYDNKVLPGERMQRKFKKATWAFLCGKKNVEIVQSYLGLFSQQDAGKWLEKCVREFGMSGIGELVREVKTGIFLSR